MQPNHEAVRGRRTIENHGYNAGLVGLGAFGVLQQRAAAAAGL